MGLHEELGPALSVMREEENSREEGEEKREKKRRREGKKRKGEKWKFFLNLEISEKIKDNL
jgi:hypothetical protein